MRNRLFFLGVFLWFGACYGIGRQELLFHATFDGDGFAAVSAQGAGQATVEGEVKKEAGRNGGYAAVFRNRGDLLRFQLSKNLNLPQGTVSLWVKELDTAEDQPIWNPYFQVRGPDKVFNLARCWKPAEVTGGLWQNGQELITAVGPLPKRNQWTQIIFTWRANATGIYVNGIPGKPSAEDVFLLTNPVGTFTLGRPKDPAALADSWHTGLHLLKDAPEKKIGQEPYGAYLLDDVAIFNRFVGPAEAKEMFEKPLDVVLKADKPGAPSLSLLTYPSSQKIRVNADFGKPLPAGTKVIAELDGLNGVATGVTCGIQDGPGGLEFGYLDAGALKPGPYAVRVRALTKGAVIAETPRVKVAVASPAKELWMDNTYGSEDVVLPGFEPLKATANAVAVWGREYRFGGAVMPRQITNQGSKMLVRPINWYLKVGGKTLPLVSRYSRLISSSPTRAVYETEGLLGELKVKGRVLVEYDGFMKFELEFIPGPKGVEADQLYMEVPFAPACATGLFHPTRRSGTWEDGWRSPFTLIYTNIITIGTPDLCLQWMTESDRYYYPKGSDSVFQGLNDNGAHTFRTNVIGGKKKLVAPFKLTFALQAGPVKVRPKNWRSWTMSSAQAALNPTGANNVQYRYDWWARAPGELIPRNGFPDKRDAALYKDQIQMTSLHFAGYRTYEEKDIDRHSPEWQRHEAEWIRIPKLYEEQGCPGWGNTYVDTNAKSWSQWYLYNAYQLFSLTGMRGLYYDDWRQGPSLNVAAGSGYLDEDGTLRPTQDIFSQRELHRRVYAIVKKFRPDDGIVIIHTASQAFLPVVAFCDVIYDGEVMIWTDLIPPEGDYFKTYRNDLFQSMFTCKQYGPVPAFHDMTMQYQRFFADKTGPNLLFVPNQRKLWGILLTHDIHMHAGFSSGAQELLNVWLDAFGMTDPAVRFHAYWEPNPAVKMLGGVLPDGSADQKGKFWASAYAKPGKVLVAVVRNSPFEDGNTVAVKMKLDRRKLGLPAGPLRSTSLESLGRSPYGKVDGDTLTVEVPSMLVSVTCNFVGVILEPVK